MMPILRFPAAFSLALGLNWLFISQAVPIEVATEDALLKSYRAKVSSVFLNLPDGAIPLYRSSYRIGDTYDPSMQHLRQTGDRCFKKLTVRSTPFEKQFNMTLSGEAAAGFLLSVKALFESGAKGDGNELVDIQFEDVVEETAVEGDWISSFDKDACPELAGVVAGDKLSTGGEPPVVIGTLYRGKRKITISYGLGADVDAKVTQLRSIANLQANVHATAQRSLVVTDDEPRPLAYAPAFVPIDIGAKQGAANEPTYSWAPYDPKQFPSHRAVLPDLNAAADKVWSWN